MRQPFGTIIAAVAAAIALTAAPAVAQHGGGGAHGGGGHASPPAHGGGTHANGGRHATPPPPVIRQAVPRTSAVRPRIDQHTVVVPSHPGQVAHLGALGLGIGMGAYAYPYSYSRYTSGYPGYYGSSSGYYYGGAAAYYGHARLRILGAPRDAQVFVDGAYVGIIDDFDGRLQHLELAPGVHQIEIRARGFAPIVFDVNAVDGRTITYRAQMVP